MSDQHNKKMLAEGPAIILVEPQLGENIGFAARAMANFGLAELRLVNPRDGWPSDKAKAAASRADHVIEATKVYPTLADAVADLQFIYATTARPREMIKPVEYPQEASLKLREMFEGGVRTGILFGRERWGLENHEIAMADAIVTFPVNPAFASLNIAQAVLLMAYEWLKTKPDAATLVERASFPPAERRDVAGLIDHLVSALQEAEYFHPPEKREKMELNLRNLIARQGFTEQEIRTLRGVVASLERRWARGRPQ